MLSAKKTEKGVVISWDKSVQLPTGAKLMLYKSYEKEPLEQYQLIENFNDDFIDLEVEKDKTINYMVKLQLPNGSSSSFSNKIEVR